MRVELNRPINGLQQVYDAVAIVQTSNIDALFVPPVFLEDAVGELGRSKVTLVTTTGRCDDLLDTKISGIDASVKNGADELIACIPQNYMHEGKWLEIEKEIEQLKVVCSAYHKFLWVVCKFHSLNRVCQVRMAELIGEGAGLRMRNAELSDVALAKICGVNRICVGSDDDYGIDAIDNFTNNGATQIVFQNRPPQKKVDVVDFHAL